MKFLRWLAHCARAAPLEFCMYGCAVIPPLMIACGFALLAAGADANPATKDFVETFIALGIFALLLSPAALLAPPIWIARRLLRGGWRKLDWREMLLHFVLAAASFSAAGFFFYMVAQSG